MDENDFARIEKLFNKQSEDFHRWLGVQGDEFQHKLDLVIDGHKMLSENLERVETSLSDKIDAVDNKLSKRIDAVDNKLSRKIDDVASDLAAHRTDTEAHHGIYRVKEVDEQFGE